MSQDPTSERPVPDSERERRLDAECRSERVGHMTQHFLLQEPPPPAGRRRRCRRRDLPSCSSSLKNPSLSLAEWDFFISAIRFRGTFRLRDGEKKEGRFFSGVGGVLKDVTCRTTSVQSEG